MFDDCVVKIGMWGYAAPARHGRPKTLRCGQRSCPLDTEKEKLKPPPGSAVPERCVGSSGFLESELSNNNSQLARLDNFCLTVSLTAFPSALPMTWFMTAFMTLPWSLGPVAWVSPMTRSMSASTSVWEKGWGR